MDVDHKSQKKLTRIKRMVKLEIIFMAFRNTVHYAVACAPKLSPFIAMELLPGKSFIPVLRRVVALTVASRHQPGSLSFLYSIQKLFNLSCKNKITLLSSLDEKE